MINYCRATDSGGYDRVTPLYVVGDAAAFLARYCVESEACRELGLAPEHFTLKPLGECDIDLGGMCFEHPAQAKLTVDGDVFSVDLDKAHGVAGAWSVHAIERLPGWWRAPGWHWFYVMPTATYVQVKAWLDRLSESPEADAEAARLDRMRAEAGVPKMFRPREQ